MSSENHRPGHVSPPVYTVSPGVYQGNVNYGFYHDHPQAPPPKYEDVISGRTTERPHREQEYETSTVIQPVIFVAPVNVLTRKQRTIRVILLSVTLILVISIFLRVLTVYGLYS